MPPLLDTHIWIWWMLGDDRLGANERNILDNLPVEERPLLSDISLWEVAMLVAGGRLVLTVSLESWLSIAASPATVRLVHLSPAIVLKMNSLPLDFHKDPADRLIVATALSLGVSLATRDKKIVDSELVPLWDCP